MKSVDIFLFKIKFDKKSLRIRVSKIQLIINAKGKIKQKSVLRNVYGKGSISMTDKVMYAVCRSVIVEFDVFVKTWKFCVILLTYVIQ